VEGSRRRVSFLMNIPHLAQDRDKIRQSKRTFQETPSGGCSAQQRLFSTGAETRYLWVHDPSEKDGGCKKGGSSIRKHAGKK